MVILTAHTSTQNSEDPKESFSIPLRILVELAVVSPKLCIFP